jgi:ABC-type uncharacterized transport system involved in gliding motility auxiliary subunit
MQRVLREEPELAKESSDLSKPRTLRQTSMRREPTPKSEQGSSPTTTTSPAMTARAAGKLPEAAAASTAIEASDRLEVDPMLVADDDEGVEDMEEPEPLLVYKSARNMRYTARRA